MSSTVAVFTAPGKDRGLFALRPIAPGGLITYDPVVPLSAAELEQLRGTTLERYWWTWPGGAAIAFGPSSMANHSQQPNARRECHTSTRRLMLVATRRIAQLEEITVDYGDC